VKLRSDFSHSTWACIHFVPWQDLAENQETPLKPGFCLCETRLDSVESEVELLSRIATAMSFPSYFRPNWNSLDECLADLEWLPADGYILVLHNADAFWRNNLQIAGLLLECWLTAAELWGKEDVPFHLVFALESKRSHEDRG